MLIQVADHTPQGRARDAERMVRGRGTRTLHGAWIGDQAAQGKAICLCQECSPKFNHQRHGYVVSVRPPFHNGVNSKCDACATPARCAFYVREGASP